MKKFLSAFWPLLSIFTGTLYAENSSTLHLRGIAQGITKTKIIEYQLSSDQTQVLFSIQNNSKYPDESQKFEFMGIEPNDPNFQIKKINGDNHRSQYQIIITEKQPLPFENRPVFLKISAN